MKFNEKEIEIIINSRTRLGRYLKMQRQLNTILNLF